MQAPPAHIERVILAYAAIWSETSPLRIQALVEQSLARDIEIVGPGYYFAGHAAVVQEALRFHKEQPGWRAVLSSGIDSHTNVARFTIAMVNPDGILTHHGEDVVLFAADGRLAKVLTFWGAVPPVPQSWPSEVRSPPRNDA